MKRKKTWQKYAMEFISIFIAVIAAFALNNWNENRRDYKAETKILTEIYNGLEKDTEDLNSNEHGHNQGLRAVRYFRNILANERVAEDSVLFHYLYLTRDFVSIQNTSGYETLKSRGLELVENDSLRRDIIALYEYNYSTLKKLEEEYAELQFQENYFHPINNLLSKSLKVDDRKRIIGIHTPLQLSPEEEKAFSMYLWKMEANRNFALQYYALIKQEIEKVRTEIEEEIANRS